MQKRNKYFDSVPGWQKGFIAIAGAAAAGYLFIKLTKKVEEKKQLIGATNELNAINQELENIQQPASFSQAQYNSWANALFIAMDGFGSDENSIYNIFKLLKNNADLLQLIKAFGIREISSGKFNPEPNVKGTLIQCITSELNAYEISKINSILDKSGITFKF